MVVLTFRSRKLDTIRAMPLHLLVPAALLALLIVAFVVFFLAPGVIHWFRQRRIEKGVSRLEGRAPPGEFRQLFSSDRKLAHLWKQYQDSLHVQREDQRGQSVVVAVRATLPAETFLNTQSMVDGRLRTEFFKHLPGIFTGIGIIGTFAGLIDGLRQFQVSENAATVRASLEALMHSVGEAFLVSASAIAAAMLVTFLEKLLLASLYAQAEEIAHSIDARFDGGAGEDYLSRLVKASEDSSTQTRTLKDSLVAELGDLMREVSASHAEAGRLQQERFLERIEAATRQQSESLGQAVAAGIERGLQKPLDAIAEAMRPEASAGAGVAEALKAFGDRLSALIDRQLASAGEVNRQGAREMQDAVQSLQSLINGMAEQMRAGQADAARSVTSNLGDIGRQVGDMLKALHDNQRQMLASAKARDEAALERTTEAVATLSGEMTGAARDAATQLSAAAAQMVRSVDMLAQSTHTALDRLDIGAESMNTASRSFVDAATRAGEAMASARSVAASLTDVGEALTTGATSLADVLGDYRTQREAVALVVGELQASVAAARKEAGMSGDVLERIERATQRLGEAQHQAEQYLAGVSHVLGDAHQAFAISVRKTLEMANTEFHDKLAASVALLSSTIAELEAALGEASPAALRAVAAPSQAGRP